MSWSEIGGAEPRRRGSAVVAWLVAVAPMAIQLDHIGHRRGPIALVVFLSAVAMVPVAVRAPARAIAAGGAALAALTLALVGPQAAVALLLALGVWSMALGVAVENDGTPIDTTALRIALGPAALSAVCLVVRTGLRLPGLLLTFAFALVIVGLARPERTRWLAGMGDRIGEVGSTLVRWVLVAPIAVFMIVQWACHRVLRYDPLLASTERSSRWVERLTEDPFPARQYAAVRVREPRRWVTTAQRIVLRAATWGVVIVLLLALFVQVTRPADLTPLEFFGTARAISVGSGAKALENDPNWTPVVSETLAYVRHGRFDPLTTFTFADFHGRFVNQEGGVRRTWRPPPCDCPRYRVWLFGGSAAWGYFQTDDFTPASQLAKAAWARGIALDVTNYAKPAYLLGQEERLFANLLVTEPPPDLAVFYDGGNEVSQQNNRNNAADGQDSSEMVEHAVQERLADYFLDSTRVVADAIDTRVDEDDRPPTHATPAEIGRLAVERYSRNHELIRRLAAASDVRTLFLWQPLFCTAPVPAAAPGTLREPAIRRHWATAYAAARGALPPDVVDMSDIFAAERRPVFADVFHTNRHGALIVGRAMERLVSPRLTGRPGT